MKRKDRDDNEEEDRRGTTSTFEFESLPHDLKMDIVSRLSGKSLTKFRRVSKMWSSIIRSRGFIDSFFSRSSSSSTQSRFMVAFSNGMEEQEERLTFFLSFGESCSSSSLVPNLEMIIPVGMCCRSNYFASLNGFISVDVNDALIVCNPTTEQAIKLPLSTRFVGYDPIDGQYKALTVGREDRNGNRQHKVLTLGGGSWRDIEGTPEPYVPCSKGVCINGVIYYGAHTSTGFSNPVLACFDVRSEKLSFIQAPPPVVAMKDLSIFIDYKGKLASIVRDPFNRFTSFELWILQDAEKPEWSKQTCVFPFSVWDSVPPNTQLSFPGTNDAGEIIIAQRVLPDQVRPFYIYYYNLQTNNITRVRLLGVGDNKLFRRSYGFATRDECYVRIAPQHVDSIASL